jgi:hypothetical protein
MRLDYPQVETLVYEGIAGRVSQHVRVNRQSAQTGRLSDSAYDKVDSGSGQWPALLRYKQRVRVWFHPFSDS